MLLSIISLILAITIAFGRQTAVFGKIKLCLWFFSHFETKRLIFSFLSLSFGAFAIYTYGLTNPIIIIETIAVLLVLFAFFFDMKYFFPEVNKVEKTRETNIDPKLKIIGVNIEDISVAYPLDDVVIPRHLINDKIGETSILISYCALCQSALAFKTNFDNKNLYFKVAGVWRRNMIIYDTETHSLWQQATGECIYGKLKGQQLELLSGINTNYESWKEMNSDTLFASKCTEARPALLSRKVMFKMLNKITPRVLVPGFIDLSDLPVRETVYGISYNGIDRAYPKSEIDGLSHFEDLFNDKKIILEYNKSSEYLSAFEYDTKKSIIVEKHWWLGWKEFHPETEIWKNVQ